VPAACSGATAEIEDAELTEKDVAAIAPKYTALVPARFVPVIVTDVPPAAGPDDGLMPATVGVLPEAW